jgi:hypothetical protein
MSSLNNFSAYLAEEVTKRMNAKLTELKAYSISVNNETISPVYLVDDVMDLLGIKSIWNKINNLIEDQEKFNRTLSINGTSRIRTLISKKAVGKIIASMRKQPHRIICDFFEYAAVPAAPLVTPPAAANAIFDVNPNNIYIKRLCHIFQSTAIETFVKINVMNGVQISLDVFLPKSGIVILFSKKSNIFDAENAPLYIVAQQIILKNHPKLKTVQWIQFASYDSNNSTQFDELLKDIIRLM